MELNKAIKSRKSVKKFSSKKPDWRDIIECIDSTRYAPMAGNNFSLKFVLINNPKTIQKLADSAQQNFINQAKYIVVVCTKPDRTKNAFGKKAQTYLRQQAGAAIENFLLVIEEKGLSTCWVGDFVESQIKDAVAIPEDIIVEAIFPIGYEVTKPKTKKAKIDLDNILYFHKYKNKKMKLPRTVKFAA